MELRRSKDYERISRQTMRLIAVFTCFNRKARTKNCIHTLVKGNPGCEFTFVAVDDNSTDGTGEMLEAQQEKGYDIHLLKGNGSLFYSGGMRLGMEYVLGRSAAVKEDSNASNNTYDYLLMLNDDVAFYDNCIEKMAAQSKEQGNAVVVGAMCDQDRHMTYSAVKYIRGIHYRKLEISEWNVPADTFNANAVLIPYEVFRKVGAMDGHYVHSLGDFDYGLSIKRAGYPIYPSKEYVGICENNPQAGGWQDVSLSRCERIRKKESIKGAPTRQWFYFLKKNFGLLTAVKGCVTPYIRILLAK